MPGAGLEVCMRKSLESPPERRGLLLVIQKTLHPHSWLISNKADCQNLSPVD